MGRSAAERGVIGGRPPGPGGPPVPSHGAEVAGIARIGGLWHSGFELNGDSGKGQLSHKIICPLKMDDCFGKTTCASGMWFSQGTQFSASRDGNYPQAKALKVYTFHVLSLCVRCRCVSHGLQVKANATQTLCCFTRHCMGIGKKPFSFLMIIPSFKFSSYWQSIFSYQTGVRVSCKFLS